MIRRPHPSVRLRLTLTYTALFVITGTALLGVSYLVVQHRVKGPDTAVAVICGRTVSGPNVTRVGGIGPPTAAGILALDPAQCPNLVGRVYYRSAGAAAGGSASGPASGAAAGGSASGPASGPAAGGSASGPASGAAAGGSASGPASGAAAPGLLREPVSSATQAEVSRLTAAVAASQSHFLDSFRIVSAIALAIMTIVSFGLSWWMAGRALGPVHRITDAARSLSERTLHDRINLQGPRDELKELADTFDAMLGRLERAFTSQRRFVANASHELRTPLATERVLIDEALANPQANPDELRMILEQLRANSEDTERVVDALLVLARSERGIERWSSVDLTSLVASVVDQSAGEAAGAGVTVSSSLEATAVDGDPSLLECLAGNLVENAIRHNVAGGSVAVSVSSGGNSPDAELKVENTGPVLDPGSVGGLVEPFRRAGPDRATNDGGVGLGLSIVNAVVRAHHGRMTLTARQEGGLLVRVQLPVAAATSLPMGIVVAE